MFSPCIPVTRRLCGQVGTNVGKWTRKYCATPLAAQLDQELDNKIMNVNSVQSFDRKIICFILASKLHETCKLVLLKSCSLIGCEN